MIDTRRPQPNEIPPEACLRFTLPASAVRTLPGGKAVVLVPLIAAQAFVRTLILNLQQQGMWPADPPAPMTAKQAAAVLREMPSATVSDLILYDGLKYMSGNDNESSIKLDGNFTADELAAIAAWMKDPKGVAEAFAKSEPPAAAPLLSPDEIAKAFGPGEGKLE